MSSRVIAGSAKGLRLKLVPGNQTRPIMDKVKEALFSILHPYLLDTYFLDLFAGTGAVGIEALSRGAEHALFTEIDRAALTTIYENLQITNLEDRADVRMIDAFDLLKNPPPHVFDFIYIAPPQYKDIWIDALRALDNNPAWLSERTTVIVQIDPREKENVAFRHLRDYDERQYGNTILWFFEAVLEEDD